MNLIELLFVAGIITAAGALLHSRYKQEWTNAHTAVTVLALALTVPKLTE